MGATGAETWNWPDEMTVHWIDEPIEPVAVGQDLDVDACVAIFDEHMQSKLFCPLTTNNCLID